MKIIILGVNQVGSTLAETLASESNDIVVVDSDAEKLRELRDRIDIGMVEGQGCHPDVLERAGGEDADMIIAVTESDEVNMVACRVAHSLFRTPKKICRLRSSSYLVSDKLFGEEGLAVDVVISPELIVSDYIARLIDLPGSLQVLDFADGQVQLVAVKAFYGGPLVGQEIRLLRQHMPSVDTRVAAIFRKDRPIIPEGSTVIEADDEVFFIAAQKDIRHCMGELRRMDKPYRRLMIAGGGNIGSRLAQNLEHRYQIKVIERNPERCASLSRTLSKSIVLNGEASHKELLLDENIEETDVFLALTNDDEANIMSSLLAKRLGAKKVMTIISNPAYVDLVQGGEIDIAISPQQATVGKLLAHVRRGHCPDRRAVPGSGARVPQQRAGAGRRPPQPHAGPAHGHRGQGRARGGDVPWPVRAQGRPREPRRRRRPGQAPRGDHRRRARGDRVRLGRHHPEPRGARPGRAAHRPAPGPGARGHHRRRPEAGEWRLLPPLLEGRGGRARADAVGPASRARH